MNKERERGKQVEISLEDHRKMKMMAAARGLTLSEVLHLAVVCFEASEAPEPGMQIAGLTTNGKPLLVFKKQGDA